jgi:hypothetical protein
MAKGALAGWLRTHLEPEKRAPPEEGFQQDERQRQHDEPATYLPPTPVRRLILEEHLPTYHEGARAQVALLIIEEGKSDVAHIRTRGRLSLETIETRPGCSDHLCRFYREGLPLRGVHPYCRCVGGNGWNPGQSCRSGVDGLR